MINAITARSGQKPNNTGHRKDGRGNEEGVNTNQMADIVKES
jgi:hypothetical protein